MVSATVRSPSLLMAMTDPSRYRPVDRILYTMLAVYSVGMVGWISWAGGGARPWFFESAFVIGGLLPGISFCLLIAWQLSAADRRRTRFSATAVLVCLAIITLWFIITWKTVAPGSEIGFLQAAARSAWA